MPDFLSISNAVVLSGIVYGAVQVIKAIVELRRGRSTGWLRIIFCIFDVPGSETERTIVPHPSGLVLIENRGPFEEFVSDLRYSVEGKGFVPVQCYRQFFDRAIDLIGGNSYEAKRFDRATEAFEIHSKAWIQARVDVSPTAWDEWNLQSDAIRKEVGDAFEAMEKQRDDPVVIEYPLSVPAGSTRRIDFDIPQNWEPDLAAITCLTVQTTKEVLHVKRAYAKPSLPCKKCRVNHTEKPDQRGPT